MSKLVNTLKLAGGSRRASFAEFAMLGALGALAAFAVLTYLSGGLENMARGFIAAVM